MMIPSRTSNLLLPWAVAAIFASTAPATDVPVFGPPPRLAITAEELAALEESPDFESRRRSALGAAQHILDEGISVPEGPGDWVFYYANPQNGQRLKPLSPSEHQCPKTGQVFSDPRTIAAYRTIQHNLVNRQVLRLAWASVYGRDERFAGAVKEVLVKLADDYDTYPGRRDRWGRTGWFAPLGGRRYSQSLSEAVGIIKLAQAYDLVRTSAVWTDAEHEHVREDLFRATARTLLAWNQGVNNHQTWYNAGLMAIASVLGDEALVQRVLTMRGGFDDQLQRSVGSDGLWYEGTIAYHFYALDAMRHIVEAGRRIGLSLHERPRFRSMFTGPLEATYPNGQFPAINDSDSGFLSAHRDFYRWAAQWYDDPRFAAARDMRGPGGSSDNDVQAPSALAQESKVLSDAGLAVLRRGQGAGAVCALVDFGPHGGGHGHLDKLQVLLYANGREWLLDPGRLSYSHHAYKTWVKHTAAHNTVTIDGRSQRPTTGRLRWFTVEEHYAACATESLAAFSGVELRRALLLTDRMLVDVFDVWSERPVQIDWFAHGVAQRVEPPGDMGPFEPSTPGSVDGYPHLGDARIAAADKTTAFQFVAEDGAKLSAWCVASPGQPERFITCAAPGYEYDQKLPCLIRRRSGTVATFVTVYDLSGDGSFVRSAALEPDAQRTVMIQTTSRSHTIRFHEGGVAYATDD